ncbi:MAG: serine/threonine protein kinase, partial [Planctomycetota bacterium]
MTVTFRSACTGRACATVLLLSLVACGPGRAHGETAVPPAQDWNQWGGSSTRNNAPPSGPMPESWAPGDFDIDTGVWSPASSSNIAWVAALGSQSYGNPVVAGGKAYVGSNNGKGYLKRYPASVDLGCLLAFDAKDGSFL